jgi:hypothetical protein
MAGALIVTAEMDPEHFAWLDALRRRYFPPERNQLAAHLTMFHALPPSAEGEVRRRLSALASERPPPAMLAGLMNLGGGVAFRVVSDELNRIRDQIADAFHGLLTAQDASGWRPHVTIQNKVTPRAAKDLLDVMEADFRPRPLTITGLGLHRYLGGPWERLAIYPFRGR